MGVQNVVFAWGADLGDPKTYQVNGVLNTPGGIEALEFYKELYQFTPPDWGNVFFQGNNQAITEGLAAMSMNYFAFFPALINPSVNKYAKVTGFFANPSGPGGRFASLGGQGASIISYSKKQDLAYKFLEWFIRDDVQQKWAALGGYTCNANVLKSKAFLEDTPITRPFTRPCLWLRISGPFRNTLNCWRFAREIGISMWSATKALPSKPWIRLPMTGRKYLKRRSS